MWSWTLKSPGEIKRKNVEMDFQESRRDQEKECGDGLPRVQARSRGRMWRWTFKIPGEIKRKNKVLDSQDSRRDEEQGGGAGLSGEPRRDQEQGDGAGLLYQDGLSCFRVVPQQLLLGHDVTLIRTAVKTAISEVHKLLRMAWSPPP